MYVCRYVSDLKVHHLYILLIRLRQVDPPSIFLKTWEHIVLYKLNDLIFKDYEFVKSKRERESILKSVIL